MARSMPWRRTASDTASWRQDQALEATIYILRQTGPTGFLLKEEGETKNFKVFLGDPHSCTCPTFMKEKEICKHICWVLLKKFRVPRQNPVTWQLGLVEREINEILRGVSEEVRPTAAARKYAAIANEAASERDKAGTIPQREITEEDVCPICQDELLAKHLPVTYCRFSCGNSIHIKCMKVWAQHQMKSAGEDAIKCPMCRENFGPISLLQQEWRNSSNREGRAERLNQHMGTTCKNCHSAPITGKCYKCNTCKDYYLCQACFNTETHTQHSFQFRQKCTQRWRPAQRSTGTVLPEAMVNNLMNRDITEQDYDTLLQLDSQGNQQLSDLTEVTVRSFPTERIRNSSTLLAPGQQCRICLRAYEIGQQIRRLPCRHKFHVDCVDNWLLHRHPTCPIDGTVYTNSSVREMREAETRRQQNAARTQQGGPARNTSQSDALPDLVLEIPGIGIARQNSTGFCPSRQTRGNTRQIPREHRLTRNLSSDSIIEAVSVANSGSSGSGTPVSIGSGGRRSRFRPSVQEISCTRDLRAESSGGHYGDLIESALMRMAERMASPSVGGHPVPSHNHRQNAEPRQPVAPSIPPIHDHSLALTVGGADSGSILLREGNGLDATRNAGRPPVVPFTESGARKGRLRNRPLYRELAHRTRSDSQERVATREMRENDVTNQNTRNLFIGHDPSSTPGFSSEFIMSNQRRPIKKTGSHARKESSADSRHRWGNTEEISGDDITLTGSGLSNLSLRDIIS